MDNYVLFFRKHTLYKAKEFHLSWIISFIGGQPVLEGCLHWRYNYLQTLGSKSAKHEDHSAELLLFVGCIVNFVVSSLICMFQDSVLPDHIMIHSCLV